MLQQQMQRDMQQQLERMHKMNLETTQEVMRSMTRMVESSLDKSRQDVDTTNAGISKLVDRINIAHDRVRGFSMARAGLTSGPPGPTRGPMGHHCQA